MYVPHSFPLSLQAPPHPYPFSPLYETRATPTIDNCTVHWFTQPLSHFSYEPNQPTYQQRYYICGNEYWNKKETSPIFFYCGNEGDVSLYVNNTGAMWENAPYFHAIMVFAEHRYYGLSQPGDGNKKLTHEQALADYVNLIYALKKKWEVMEAPVIAFGGSYGGMLATYMRLKYPNTILAAWAASAPIMGFKSMGWDTSLYWNKVTYDASPEAGCARACIPNMRKLWPVLFNYDKKKLQKLFHLCEPITNDSGIERLAAFIYNAWDILAMGNFPYSSSYLTNGKVDLDAFPVRLACSKLADPTLSLDPEYHIEAVREAVGVLYNATGTEECYNVSTDVTNSGLWDYQWCTQSLPQETYFSMNGVTDMFYKRPYNKSAIIQHCLETYGIHPKFDTMQMIYGNKQDIARYGSNIIFTNGNYDPWAAGGITESLGASMPAFIIDQGAHHLDLMFSHPNDPQSVINVRQKCIKYIDHWLKEYRASMHQGKDIGLALLRPLSRPGH